MKLEEAEWDYLLKQEYEWKSKYNKKRIERQDEFE